MAIKEGYAGRVVDANKAYIYLEGLIAGAGWEQSQRALPYMREHHAGQMRKDGQPYEVHPLSMACYAVSLESQYITDDVVATILLHDVCEDTSAVVEELPFNETVKRGVKYMTLLRFDNETNYELKKRYMNELLESKEATITKALDRFCNLTTMVGSFSEEKIRKNIVETNELLLLALRKAKKNWPEMQKLLYVLRRNIMYVNDMLAIVFKVKLMDKNFVNVEGAEDCSALVTGK